jgi:RNA polymerase I-specific transcription initiation factor RRN3
MEMGKNEQESENSGSEAGSLLCISSDSKQMTSKLDALLCIMFDYIKSLSKKALIEDTFAQDFSLVFDGMLHSFDNMMLPTHKLRSAQFIIFYYCSLETYFAQDFMGLLVTHLVEPSNSSVLRMASSSYLGSFIARAKFIDIASVRQCLSILNHQCQTYVDQNESGIKGRLEVLEILKIRLIATEFCMGLFKLFCIFFVLDGSN